LITTLLRVASTLWVMRYYPVIKNFDFSSLSSGQLNILFVASTASMLGLIMTAVYLYKMYSWYDSPKASPKAMTALFVISSLFLGLISIIIVIVIFWQSKKLLIDKEEAE